MSNSNLDAKKVGDVIWLHARFVDEDPKKYMITHVISDDGLIPTFIKITPYELTCEVGKVYENIKGDRLICYRINEMDTYPIKCFCLNSNSTCYSRDNFFRADGGYNPIDNIVKSDYDLIKLSDNQSHEIEF